MTATSERSALDASLDLVMQKIERRMEAKLAFDALHAGPGYGSILLDKATVELENAISLYNQELVRCVQLGGLVP